MAWNVPPTWVVGAILPAADLNTYVRDNLNYLKGSAGAFALDAMFTATAADANTARTGALTSELIVTNSNNGGVRASGVKFRANDSGAGGAILSAGRVLGTFLAPSFNDASLILQTAAATEVFQDTLTLRGANVGIGTSAPAGRLHAAGAGGGMLFLSAAGVGSSVVTLAPAGTVNALAVIYGMIRNNGGSTVSFLGFVSGNGYALGSSSVTNVSSAADQVTLTVTGGGAITAQRTAGGNSHNVNLLVLFY